MVRKASVYDLDKILEIWLNTNIKTHSYINEKYWIGKLPYVRLLLEKSQLYVYEENEKIEGFIGVIGDYIAGIFVQSKVQCRGIGSRLIKYVKAEKRALSLNVYKKNRSAVEFYKKLGFKIDSTVYDADTNEEEYTMAWKKSHLGVDIIE